MLHLPTSWTDEWLESGAYVWLDVDARPACRAQDGDTIAQPDDGDKVDCPDCKPYVWSCGCIAHHTKPGGMGVFCITEDNGYCNFECPHDEEDYEERKSELIEAGVPEDEAIKQAEREVNEAREASIATRRTNGSR
jgi:hypothetical protein